MEKSTTQCPEPEAAATYGGCPGRESDPTPKRSFKCAGTDCPVAARRDAVYGAVVTMRALGAKITIGKVIPLRPANDNDNTPTE